MLRAIRSHRGSGSLVKPVDILCDDGLYAARLLKFCQRNMGRVGFRVQDVRGKRLQPAEKSFGLRRNAVSEATCMGSNRFHNPLPAERNPGYPRGQIGRRR